MKKASSFTLCATVASFCALLLAGCGENLSDSNPISGTSTSGDTPQQELYICVYDGGYGTEWINTLAAQYEEKTGVKVYAEADQSILDRLEDQLENQSDYDIYMSHDINWRNFAARGLLADLDDLYARDVEGTDATFAEHVVTGGAELSIGEGENGDEHYYKVPYTQGAGGLVYNIDMFVENGWSIPTTYAELLALAQTIVSAQIEIPGTRDYVVPFAWSGSDRQYYWDYLVFEWWAQLAGLEKVNQVIEYKGPTGGYSDGFEMYNPTTYYKEFMDAYDMWYDLIALHSNYSTADSYGNQLATAQAQFANGQAAMIPYGHWAKYEIENAIGRELDFDIAMMKTPKATASSIEVNYMVGFGDSMIIPENTPNKDVAMDFLAYMATEEACVTFVEKAEGAFLAFDYNDVDLSALEESDTYIKSIREKLTEGNNFHLSSANPITYWNVNSVMPWLENTYFYASACAKPTNNTASIIGADMYNRAEVGWPVWLRNAGLR